MPKLSEKTKARRAAEEKLSRDIVAFLRELDACCSPVRAAGAVNLIKLTTLLPNVRPLVERIDKWETEP